MGTRIQGLGRLWWVAALLVIPTWRESAALPPNFVDEPVIAGLGSPIAMDQLPDGRFLVAERAGRVLLVDPPSVTTLFTIPGVSTLDENGLLGLVADPAFPLDIYCLWTSSDSLNVARYSPGGTLEQWILRLPNLATTHNGGTLRFGLDSRLYASIGDDHLTCAAGDSSTLTGKILRLGTCHTDPAPPEVAAYGLRNAFRFSVDPLSGALWIGDVGEAAWEEMDVLPQGPPLDFGWPAREGPTTGPYAASCPAQPNAVDPVWSIDHTSGAKAIVAGPYYRRRHQPGDFPPAWRDRGYASDFYSGVVWAISGTVAQVFGEGYTGVTDWLEAQDGVLWYADMTAGEIRRIRYAGLAAVPSQGANPGAQLYDLQGRRITDPRGPGIYFTSVGRRVVILK